jgi:ribonuclease P protein component
MTGTQAWKFPPARRVRRRWEFNRIHREGVRVSTRSFTVIARVAVQGEQARLGLAVNRRVGNAVLRNRLRRLIRETFRAQAASLPAVDLVVIVKPEAASLAGVGLVAVQSELKEAFCSAASRATQRGSRGRPGARASSPRREPPGNGRRG